MSRQTINGESRQARNLKGCMILMLELGKINRKEQKARQEVDGRAMECQNRKAAKEDGMKHGLTVAKLKVTGINTEEKLGNGMEKDGRAVQKPAGSGAMAWPRSARIN